jgi:Carboxypeptidase regulatory-like domain/TonB-dependent Receptor Plug Domain
MKNAAIVALSIALLSPLRLAAQEQTGTLQGKIVDDSGTVLPGVTVTVKGPTILGGSMTTVSTDTGYRLQNIPLGIYTVVFELSGFQTKAYEGVRVQAGATFTIDPQLGVAPVQETVTVVGETPIIETAATDLTFTFSRELMSTIPNARDVWAMVAQTPGLRTSTINVGGTQTGNQLAFTGHGVDSRQNTYYLNGANITNNDGTGASLFYYDVDSFDEMQVESNSHNAEVQTPGIVINLVPKTGTNVMHGSASGFLSTDSIQSDNVDTELRNRGVDRASNLHKYYDGGFDLGLPLVRDKLWIWGAARRQNVERFVTGTRNADGTFPIDRTVLWFPSVKANWMATPHHNVSAFYFIQQKNRYNSGLSPLRPLETTVNQTNDPIPSLWTVRDDWTATSRTLVSLKVNVQPLGAFHTTQVTGVDPNTPARMDVGTGVWSAAAPSFISSGRTMRSVGGTVSHSIDEWAGGRHTLKMGLDLNQYTTPVLNTYPGDVRLLFLNTAPLQVILFGAGKQNAVDRVASGYAQDGYQVGRATFNFGVRWDRQTNSLPEETAPQSRYLPDPVRQAATGNLFTWNTFAPRIGVIYDLTGDAKTLAKASYSRYYWQLWTRIGSQASLAGDRLFTYTWSDPNGDKQFSPDELGTLVSVNDPSTRPVTIDPNLKPTKTDEFTATVSREVMGNVSLSGTFIARKDDDLDWKINPNITPSDYTAVNGIDPGADGKLGTADDGGLLTFYELSAAKRTLSPNLITTRTGFSQRYRGVEITLHRRLTGRWQFVGSTTFGRQSETYGPGSFFNPQDIDKLNDTRVDTSLPFIGKIMASYRLPFDVTVSGFYQHLSGAPYTTQVNSAVSLGRALNQGNVTILSGTRNVSSLDGVNLLDLRFNYDLHFGRSRIGLSFDVFNVTNSNTVTSINAVEGTAYGRVLDFIAPRILRFGGRIQF